MNINAKPPKTGEDMDEYIAGHVMGFPEEALANRYVPIPAYSTCRAAVGDVMHKLRDHVEFNEALKQWCEECNPRWKESPAWTFWLTPHDICRLAFKVIGLPDDLEEKS